MNKKRHPQSGMALIITLIFAGIAIALLATLTARIVNQRNQVNHYVLGKECFYGLDAAVAECKARIERGEEGKVGLDQWQPQTTTGGTFVLPCFDDSGVTPETLLALDNVEYIALAQMWQTDGIDNNGDGTIDGIDERNRYTIHAFARNGTEVRQVEAIYAGDSISVWDNAIFAGTGQAGGLINGNVSIHGGVHLLGDDLPAGGTALAAIDLSGASLIHNNYDGIPADLEARVPPIVPQSWDGEMVETLEAKLRVKNGLVGMSGNSEIGSPDVKGNDIKETMDGTYVNDGWTGNDVIDDGDRGDPKSVWADNGWDEGYDLGDAIPFPELDDDWKDPFTGATVYDGNRGRNYTHEEYFSEVLIGDPLDPNDGVYNGNMTFYTKGSPVYWNASTNTYSTTLPATTPPANEDWLMFNPSTDVLRVNGQIRINGNVKIYGQGNQTRVSYSGRAALLVDGDCEIACDMVTCRNGDSGNVTNTFPVENILGLMITGDMAVGTTSQMQTMGAFYAAGEISSAKQTITMGTFVSNYFNMGSQVPDIFQVPSLSANLPIGMIGAFPITVIGRVAWREVGVDI